MEERKYTKQEIFEIIDKEIKRQLELKNQYIAKNGFKHVDVLNRFAAVISTLSGIYDLFK